MYGFRDAVHQKLWDGNFREMEKLNICILFHAFMQLSLLWKGNFHFDRQNIHVGPQVLCCFWVSVALPVTWGAPQYGGPGHGIIQPMNQVAMTHASWLSTQCTSSSWPGGPQCPWDGNQNGQVKSNLTWFFFYHSIGTYCCCFSVAKSCLTPLRSMDCSPQSSTVHEILQVRILEWVGMLFHRGSYRPSDWARVSSTAGRLYCWAIREDPPPCLPV